MKITHILYSNFTMPTYGYFGGNELHEVHEEKKIISNLLAKVNLNASVSSMGALELLRESAGDGSKVMHLAMHGGVSSYNDHSTLLFKNKYGLPID